MTVSVSVCGAAGMVTGSCYLVRHPQGAFLVDCGLFQGNKTVRQLNYGRFPFAADLPDTVLFTHAHIDHSGLFPKLVKAGFSGRALATAPTRDLLSYMLPDSGHIQEIEVERLNRRNARRGRAAVTPIYGESDAEAAVARIDPVDYGDWVAVGQGARARFWDAGHLLGSASIEVEIDADADNGAPLRLLFSGDIGPGNKAFHDLPDGPTGCDYVFMESTYGDRERDDPDNGARQARLGKEVREALLAGGNLLIPSFAVERTQELLADLAGLFDAGALPEAEVFIDSPLANRATEVFRRHLGAAGRVLERPNFHAVPTLEASMQLDRIRSGAVILSASGMCDAGRVRHHLKSQLWRPASTVLLVGYQAPGTLGRVLMDGAKSVRIQGEPVEVRARLRRLDIYSGHADRDGLVAWAQARMPIAKGLYITHGEPRARTTLTKALIAAGLPEKRIAAPQLDETLVLRRGAAAVDGVTRRMDPRALHDLDWHNLYSEVLLGLGDRLDHLPDDAAREKLLRRVKRLLGERAA